VLFACGFEPNERIEGVIGCFPERSELESFTGFAPIQIVAASLLASLSEKEMIGESAFNASAQVNLNVMKYLVLNGARLSLETPPRERPGHSRQSTSKSNKEDDTRDDDDSDHSRMRPKLKIQSNKELMKILHGSEIVELQKVWSTSNPAPASSKSVFFTDKLAIENSTAPGGSDDKSCAICWKAFGIVSRKHRCRLSRRFICDECSSQRVTGIGGEYRVSDGQYLLAKAEAGRKATRAAEQTKSISQEKRYAGTAARLERLEAQETAERETLFGGIVASVTSVLAGTAEQDPKELGPVDSISGLSTQLNQTRDALNERGAKLNSLADKSDKLVSASQDFAAMAKELNRKSNQGFFPW
jgi:hypothetical protein